MKVVHHLTISTEDDVGTGRGANAGSSLASSAPRSRLTPAAGGQLADARQGAPNAQVIAPNDQPVLPPILLSLLSFHHKFQKKKLVKKLEKKI